MVDAACDLPPEFLAAHGIDVLPIQVRDASGQALDLADPATRLAFYAGAMRAQARSLETVPCRPAAIVERALGQWVRRYDFVFCQTLSRSRSAQYDHATRASFEVLSDYRASRDASGRSGPFALRVQNSGSFFAGQGVLAAETARLIASGLPPTELRTRLERLGEAVQAYAVPRDLGFLRARMLRRGDHSLGRLGTLGSRLIGLRPVLSGSRDRTRVLARVRGHKAACGRLLAHLRRQVERGLQAPFVVLSYAGPLEELRALPGHAELAASCEAAGVRLLECVMNPPGAVNLGPGALSAGVLGKRRKFQ